MKMDETIGKKGKDAANEYTVSLAHYDSPCVTSIPDSKADEISDLTSKQSELSGPDSPESRVICSPICTGYACALHLGPKCIGAARGWFKDIKGESLLYVYKERKRGIRRRE